MASTSLAPQRWNPHPWLSLLLSVLLAAAAGFYFIQNMHSYFKHHAESEQAYNCFQHHGPSAVWRAHNEKKETAYHFLCEDQMGDLFDIVLREDGEPLSAYRLHARPLPEAINYVRRKPGAAHVPLERIPAALWEAITPHLPATFLGG